MPTTAIRRTLVTRSLLDVLGGDRRRLFATLREQVYPLLDGRDQARMTVYLSLFDADEPERVALETINELCALDDSKWRFSQMKAIEIVGVSFSPL